jgi:hypothetical protein
LKECPKESRAVLLVSLGELPGKTAPDWLNASIALIN